VWADASRGGTMQTRACHIHQKRLLWRGAQPSAGPDDGTGKVALRFRSVLQVSACSLVTHVVERVVKLGQP